MADYDSPWKEVTNEQFASFLAFCFPLVYADIDLTQDQESLEQEMHKLLPASRTGKRLVDKLVKLCTHAGDVRYLHAEVQGEPEEDFERRMDTYNYRARDRLGQEVVSVAVLADDDPRWKPEEYRFGCWGCERYLKFAIFKVLDWAGREQELLEHANPFALFVLAHLQSRQTREDVAERGRVKLGLILKLTQKKLGPEEMRAWYRYFDWLLPLPQEEEAGLWQEIKRRTEETIMPFVTFAERYGFEQGEQEGRKEGLKEGLKEGHRKGLLEGLALSLELKFGEAGTAFVPELERQEKLETLEAVLVAIKSASSVEDLRKLVAPCPVVDGSGAAP